MDKEQIEKVKKGLECCSTDAYRCNECPYIDFGITTNECCGYIKICADALKLINELQAKSKPEWIPVSENPMAWFNKLVSFKYQGETYFGEGHWTGAKWVVTGFPNNKFPNEIEVTHWMQPPELPKDGE